jgi:hypothetical protein
VLDSLAVSGGSRRPEATLRRLRRLTSVEPTRIARRRLLVRDHKIAEGVCAITRPIVFRPATNVAVLVLVLVIVPKRVAPGLGC